MSVQKLLLSPALDGEFFTHLRLAKTDDAAFVAQLYSDPTSNRHIDPLSTRIAACDQRKWISQYKVRESAGKEFFLLVRHQMTDFGSVRIHDFNRGRRSFRWGSWVMKADRPSGLLAFSAISVYEIGFEIFGLEQAEFDVKRENTDVIKFHLKSGAEKIDEADEVIRFAFSRRKFQAFKEANMSRLKMHRCFCG